MDVPWIRRLFVFNGEGTVTESRDRVGDSLSGRELERGGTRDGRDSNRRDFVGRFTARGNFVRLTASSNGEK